MTTMLECRHHWVIDIPNGPTSEGRCILCGEVRYFGNTLESALSDKYKHDKGYYHLKEKDASLGAYWPEALGGR